MGDPGTSLLAGSSVVVMSPWGCLPGLVNQQPAARALSVWFFLLFAPWPFFLGPPRELGAERDQMSISPGDHGQLVNVVRH